MDREKFMVQQKRALLAKDLVVIICIYVELVDQAGGQVQERRQPAGAVEQEAYLEVKHVHLVVEKV